MLRFGTKFKVLSLVLVLLFLLSCYGCKTIEEETSGTLSQTPAINNESEIISSESSEPTQSEPTKEPRKDLQLVIPDNPKGSRYSDVLATDDGGFIIIGYYWVDKNGSSYPISTVEKYNSKCERKIKKEFEAYQFISIKKSNEGDIVLSAKCWNGIDYFNIITLGTDLAKKSEIKLGKDITSAPKFAIISGGNVAVAYNNNEIMILNVFDNSGKKIKTISLGESKFSLYTSFDVCAVDDGGFYITMSANIAENSYFKSYGSKGGKDIYIAKFNKDYALENVINLGGSSDEVNKYISVAKDGSLFVVFNSDSTDKDLSGLGLPGKSTAQILFKIDKTGKTIFKTVISDRNTYISSTAFVLEMSNGDIAVCGSESYNNGIFPKYKIDYNDKELDKVIKYNVNYEMLLDKSGKIKNVDMVLGGNLEMVVAGVDCETAGATLLKDGRIIIAGFFIGSTVLYGGTEIYYDLVNSYCIYDIYAYEDEK